LVKKLEKIKLKKEMNLLKNFLINLEE